MDDYEAGELAVRFEESEPEELLGWALDRFGDRGFALISSFQAEAMVLIDMTWRITRDLRVITIDTGRLPQETHDHIDRVREHYAIQVEVELPDPEPVVRMVREHGPNLFRESVVRRLLCCQLRKVRPLDRILEGLDAWATGLRRDQWATRANLPKVGIDHDHGGLVKLSPLADWTHEEIWDYLRDNDVPVHPLHARGYPSIGCLPCSRPVAEGDDPRSGRWWWETGAPKECGMHCAIETGGLEHEIAALLEPT